MSKIEKIILIGGVLFSFGLGFLIRYVFSGGFTATGALWLASLGILLWLLPFGLSTLLVKNAGFSIAGFVVGSLALLIIASNIYVVLGIFLLCCAFINWLLRVRFARNLSIKFSVWHITKGLGFFLIILALFGGLLSFYSPYSKETLFEPKIPPKLFDSVYEPLSKVILGQLNQQLGGSSMTYELLSDSPLVKSFLSDPKLSKIPGANDFDKLPVNELNELKQPVLNNIKSVAPQIITADEVKSRLYENLNKSVSNLGKQYESYIPFAFAAGTFFLLQLIFVPLKYATIFMLFVLIRLFVKIGWLEKKKINIEVETIWVVG